MPRRVWVTHRVLLSDQDQKSQGFALPLFLPWEKKWPFGLTWVTLAVGLYEITNHFPTGTPSEFLLTSWDSAIPFLPETIWIYASLALFIPASFLTNRCVISLNKHLYSFGFLVVLSVGIFCFFPIKYPREIFPIPLHTTGWTAQLLNHLRGVDPPNNCFPSLHVSIATEIALGFLHDQRRYLPFFSSWAILLSLSTLTTKQHYIWDLIAGLGLAFVVHFIFHRMIYFRWSRS